jgi:hypothetical protein
MHAPSPAGGPAQDSRPPQASQLAQRLPIQKKTT